MKNAPKTRADIAASLPPVRKWGQFQEKKILDMRDIIHVLEKDRDGQGSLVEGLHAQEQPRWYGQGLVGCLSVWGHQRSFYLQFDLISARRWWIGVEGTKL